LLAELQGLAHYVQDTAVVNVRNAVIHGNNDFPASSEIKTAVERLRLCRERLVESGLYPRTFNLVNRSMDAYGRERLRYVSGSDGIDLAVPQWPLAPRLPMAGTQLLVVPAASLGS